MNYKMRKNIKIKDHISSVFETAGIYSVIIIIMMSSLTAYSYTINEFDLQLNQLEKDKNEKYQDYNNN